MKNLKCPECGGGRIIEYGRMYYDREVEHVLDDGNLVLYGTTNYEPTEGSPDTYACDDCGFDDSELSPFIEIVKGAGR